MDRTRHIFSIIALFSVFSAAGQSVINSAGGHHVAGGISVSDNIGEPFVQTAGPASSVMITEGFLQPFMVYPGFSVSVMKSDLTCTDLQDGKISLAVSTPYKYKATYLWSSGLCPGKNCQSVDSLRSGTYSLSIRFTYTTSAGLVKQDSSFSTHVTVNDANGPCVVHIHNGFTPNSDNINDTWKIDNINAFKPNKVSIFNRWGQEVYSTEDYDNETKVWSGKDNKQRDLPSGTYFYIVELGSKKPIKGWVELLKE